MQSSARMSSGPQVAYKGPAASPAAFVVAFSNPGGRVIALAKDAQPGSFFLLKSNLDSGYHRVNAPALGAHGGTAEIIATTGPLRR